MKTLKLSILAFCMLTFQLVNAQYSAKFRNDISPKAVLEFSVGTPISELRSVPVTLDKSGAVGILIIYNELPGGGGPNTDFFEMPQGVISFVMFNDKGEQMWRKDLTKSMVPNTNYCPVLPFDLDGDGSEEIWYINNPDQKLPLASSKFVVEAMNPKTGEVINSFKWPAASRRQPMGNIFRNALLGCYVDGKPVLVTGQGIYSYGPMVLNGYDSSLKNIWSRTIPVGDKGPRGSHTTMIVDIDQDGNDEFMWGERCVSAKDGKDKFVMSNKYTGHADVVQPFYNWDENKWYLFSCRENGESPRLIVTDDKGKEMWTDLTGHVDKGWVAHFSPTGEYVSTVLDISGRKYKVGDQVIREGKSEIAYKTLTGERIELPFEGASSSRPVDINGDGIHEITNKGKLVDINGKVYKLGSRISHISKFLNYPGEQIVTWERDGTIRVFANEKGEDTPQAKKRYAHPFYKSNQRLSAVGANGDNLSGL